jgi:hypothetical protein
VDRWGSLEPNRGGTEEEESWEGKEEGVGQQSIWSIGSFLDGRCWCYHLSCSSNLVIYLVYPIMHIYSLNKRLPATASSKLL